VKKLIFVALLFLVVSCSDTNIIVPTSPTSVVTNPNNPGNPNNPIVTQNKIEFRVSGNATGARIRYSNSNDGIAQVTSVLPFVFNITTNQQSIFLSLEATPTGYSSFTISPFVAAQIFVNGLLFRETASSDFLFTTITVSGTWRAN
jgi:hypothetical protein